ncbi:MAG: hypothetical protein KatS3mg105_1106 [Gemmatales bacterium]|nr:MAG: hypothetical protein KatS3mg105_1106 [Gemmatales bacterium]
MICPNCGHDNLPGSEHCDSCLQDLTQLDQPTAQNRVERSLMEDHVSTLGHPERRPVTIRPEMSIRQAIDLMLAENVGALLVVDDSGKLIGILTERDMLLKIAGIYGDYEQLFVSDFMTPDPVTVTVDHSLAFAVHKMDIGDLRHLPVVDDGIPKDVISVRDMLHHITRLCKES